MSESKLSAKILKTLKHLDAIPVDNPRKPGTPDVNYVEGWLELKYLKEWPKRSITIVRIPTWTPQQGIRHYLRNLAGGNSKVLLQVGTEYLLFQGSTAYMFFNEVMRSQMYLLAIKVWDRYPDKDLCEYLK